MRVDLVEPLVIVVPVEQLIGLLLVTVNPMARFACKTGHIELAVYGAEREPQPHRVLNLGPVDLVDHPIILPQVHAEGLEPSISSV